jgi:Fe(3+) dicitrate transport protein
MRIIYLFLLIIPVASFAQPAVSGVLISSNGNAISNQELFLSNGETAITNDNGEFSFKRLAKSSYNISTETGGQLLVLINFKYADTPLVLKLTMQKTVLLSDVVISDKSSIKNIERMPDVKDNIIYAGKKNEVIKLNASTANLSQNVSRQVFARVPGIQIWESDGSGVQIGIAARGLSPNRMWEFNTRQNGYDISADPFGYPEAYYTPSLESIERIEIIRGAASLQFGPQFGGVVNFIKKQSLGDKPLSIELSNTLGSYGMFSNFNSIGGQKGKWNYYANFNYRRSDGWRTNNSYQTWNAYAHAGYQLSKRIKVSGEYTRMHQLVQQPGGLNDSMFQKNAQLSLRNRNWFNLEWNILAASADIQLGAKQKLTLKTSYLFSDRNSIGNTSPITQADIATPNGVMPLRTIDRDQYHNWGTELRYLLTYNLFSLPCYFSSGVRYYQGRTNRMQNKWGSRGDGFSLDVENTSNNRDLQYTTKNYAAYLENLIYINSKLSVSPGVRIEQLENNAQGISDAKTVDRQSKRTFVLGGLALQYKSSPTTQVYANITQAYRPVLFSDLTVVTTDSINPNLKDANGYNADLGFRGNIGKGLMFDMSIYYLYYGNRIGSYVVNGKNYKTNIGASETKGIECYIEAIPTSWLESSIGQISVFSSISYTQSVYTQWNNPDVTKNLTSKRVENTPEWIQRYGVEYMYKKLKLGYTLNYVGNAYADALNSTGIDATGTTGVIPAYSVNDFTISYLFTKHLRFNAGINNVWDNRYFTRRSGGYPGPGLLPADGRSMYFSLQFKW